MEGRLPFTPSKRCDNVSYGKSRSDYGGEGAFSSGSVHETPSSSLKLSCFCFQSQTTCFLPDFRTWTTSDNRRSCLCWLWFSWGRCPHAHARVSPIFLHFILCRPGDSPPWRLLPPALRQRVRSQNGFLSLFRSQ